MKQHILAAASASRSEHIIVAYKTVQRPDHIQQG